MFTKRISLLRIYHCQVAHWAFHWFYIDNKIAAAVTPTSNSILGVSWDQEQMAHMQYLILSLQGTRYRYCYSCFRDKENHL